MKQHGCTEQRCDYLSKVQVGRGFRTIGVHWHNIQTDEGTDAASDAVIQDTVDHMVCREMLRQGVAAMDSFSLFTFGPF